MEKITGRASTTDNQDGNHSQMCFSTENHLNGFTKMSLHNLVQQIQPWSSPNKNLKRTISTQKIKLLNEALQIVLSITPTPQVKSL